MKTYQLILLGLLSHSVLAAPNFKSSTSDVDNDGSLTVCFDERGLGGGDIDYTLTADATATFACFNRGGHNPAAANKRSIETPVVATDSFASKNGRVQACIDTDEPSPGTFSCTSGQRLVLADVTYSDIVLTDTTNDVTTSVPDASEVFVVV